MNNIYAIISIIFLTLNCIIGTTKCYAQAEGWLWAKSAGSSSWDNSYSICTDMQSNVYMTGSFKSPSIIWGANTLINNDTSGVTEDIFIVKYDSNGNVLWAKSAGGSGIDLSNSICVDAQGNVFVTGEYNSTTFSLGSDTLFNFDSSGNYDIFIIKYDSVGNTLWAKGAGGSSYDNSSSVCTDLQGNILITGSFKSHTVIFGSYNLMNYDTLNFSEDIFVAKYDNSGNVLWAKSAGGYGYEESRSVCCDVLGNIYITGSFGSQYLGLGTCYLERNGVQNYFLIKFDSQGNAILAKSSGGFQDDNCGKSVSVDEKGNIYTTGFFDYYSTTFDTVTVVNNNSYIAPVFYLVKYDSLGNLLFVKTANGIGQGHVVTTDTFGNVLVSGIYFNNPIVFDSDTLINNEVINVFLIKYDSLGYVIWAESIGIGNSPCNSGVSSDPQGNVYVSGSFYCPVMIIGADTLSYDSFSDIFLAKHSSIITGVYDTFTNEKVTMLYPNPATEILYLTKSNSIGSIVEIISSNGESIKNCMIKNNSINISSLPTGLYLLRIVGKDNVVTGRFIKL